MTPEQIEALADTVEESLGDIDIVDYHAVLKTLGFRRPWKDSNTGWANVLDQLLHVAYAMMVFLPVVAWPTYWGAALSGFVLAVIREWEQWRNWDFKLLLPGNRLLDIASFILGAVLLFLLIQVIFS